MAAPTSRLVARIGKPHGLHGEVTVQLHTDEPERRLAVGEILDTEATPGSGIPRTLQVRSARLHRAIWLVGFEEIPDRAGAESLRGTRLLYAGDAPSEGDSPEDEDAWYEDDLVGLTVADPAGATLGEVTGLQVGAAQDRLFIALPDGRTAEIPFVEALVPEVDVAGGRVVVDAPPGLFDLAE